MTTDNSPPAASEVETTPAPAEACRSGCAVTKSVRVAVALLALGTAAAYGALNAKPELVDYLPYLSNSGPSCCPMQGRTKAGHACAESCGSHASTPAESEPTVESADESAFFAIDETEPVVE